MTFPARAVTWRGWGYGAGLTLVSRGWFAPGGISPPLPLPPSPKKKTRRPIIKRRRGGGGGGGGTRSIERLLDPHVHFHDPEEAIEPKEADFALIHVNVPGATVKALADGSVEIFIDEKGRTSIVLSGDDGTRYWYADVGASAVRDGARVRAGQPIARTKLGAAPVPPSLVRRSGVHAALPSPERSSPPKPAQIVFIETPVPPPPPRRLFKLVPVPAPPLPPSEWAGVAPPERRRSTAIAYVAGIGALVALLFALNAFKPSPRKPERKRRRKRRRKR